MYNQTNGAKSINGNNLNSHVSSILFDLKSKGKIKAYYIEPKYAHPEYSEKQFNPDFEIHTLNDEIIVIDNTTSARSDRLKQKQWDALGTRIAFHEKTIRFYVVVPDELSQKEYDTYIHESNKIRSGNRFSMISDIIQVSDLIKILTT